MSQERAGTVQGVRTWIDVTRQSGSRTWDERLVLRRPELARALLAVWSRLPARWRLRRAWLARNICRGAAAGNRRDFDLLFLFLDPEIEYESLISDTGGAVFPDVVGVQAGHAGYRGTWAALDEAWDGVRLEHFEVIDFGDRVIAHGRIVGHARHTGIAVDQPIAQLFTMRRGLVVRQHDFAQLEEALAAVGRTHVTPAPA